MQAKFRNAKQDTFVAISYINRQVAVSLRVELLRLFPKGFALYMEHKFDAVYC